MSHDAIDRDEIVDDLRHVEEHGYVVVERLLSPDELASLRRALVPHLGRDPHGRNNFEGHRTQRVYSLVGKGEPFARLAAHPRVLALCDTLLHPGFLLTASQAICIHPGETPQPFHTDDTFYPLPRPRKAISVGTIFALDEFTIENGATQVVSGSHLWGDAQIAEAMGELADQFVPASGGAGSPKPAPPLPEVLRGRVLDVAMPAGSVMFFLGTLLHRGGENRSQASRLAISNQYCEPWARQQENFLLSIPVEVARGLPPRVQALLGYSIHPPFMGHVDGRHPLRLLDS